MGIITITLFISTIVVIDHYNINQQWYFLHRSAKNWVNSHNDSPPSALGFSVLAATGALGVGVPLDVRGGVLLLQSRGSSTNENCCLKNMGTVKSNATLYHFIFYDFMFGLDMSFKFQFQWISIKVYLQGILVSKHPFLLVKHQLKASTPTFEPSQNEHHSGPGRSRRPRNPMQQLSDGIWKPTGFRCLEIAIKIIRKKRPIVVWQSWQ